MPERRNDEDTILHQQIRYYRARAAEYDVTSSLPDDPHLASINRVRSAFRQLELRGKILELAAGTGQWTSMLAEHATELTAVDASPEMLSLNAQKTSDPRVRYVESDIFELRPQPAWDVVFFGFWLSHVPQGHFQAFWDLIAQHLLPDGRAVFVDEVAPGVTDEEWIDEAMGVVRRRLTDGSAHRAVKVLWEADELEARLRSMAWDAHVHAEGPFYWGWATPQRKRPLTAV